MKNPYELSIAYRGIAVFTGVLIPVSLILSIPVLYKSELAQKEEQPPIILEMMALHVPQQKPVKSVEKVKRKPKSAKKPKPVKPKIVKNTMLAKAKPEIKKIPQQKEIPLEKTEPVLQMPVPIFKLTQAPQFLHKGDLIYPEVMRSSGVTGIVKLAVLIGKEGKVYRITVLKSAGEAFDEAAKKALLTSTFVPAKVGNKRVAVELRIPVKFRLL